MAQQTIDMKVMQTTGTRLLCAVYPGPVLHPHPACTCLPWTVLRAWACWQIQEDSFALKTVLQYYGYWEPPPVPKDAVMFYERVLLPKISLDELKDSITLRGTVCRAAKGTCCGTCHPPLPPPPLKLPYHPVPGLGWDQARTSPT